MNYVTHEKYKLFESLTSIELEPNCGLDTSMSIHEWHGVAVATEIVVADFRNTRILRQEKLGALGKNGFQQLEVGTMQPEIIEFFAKEFAFLSNFHIAGLTYEGDIYNSAEAAYQAAKISIRRERIAFMGFNCKPWQAKRMGKNLSLFDTRKDWDSVKEQIMLDVLRAKFESGLTREKLLQTGDATLINGNTHHDNW